jgi:hypothetical protein
MNDRLREALRDLRWLVPAALIAVAGFAAGGRAVFEKRAEIAVAERRTASLESEILDLEARVAEVRRDRELRRRTDRGHGPGGIRSDWEDVLFDGPTAARSALELVLAAETAGFDRLRYVAEEVRTVAKFPPAVDRDGDEGEDAPSPIRERIDLVEWPIRIAIDSDWDSLVDLLGRLTEAEPAFALRGLEIGIRRDGRGDPIDGLSLEGEISTYWTDAEAGS